MGTSWFFRSANFVNGSWIETKSGERWPVFDPATGKSYHSIPVAGPEDVDAAVIAAKSAFEGWSALTPAARANYLIAIADVVERKKDELARLETLDNGKPLKEAMADIADVADCFRYYAGLALTVNPSDKDGQPISLPSSSFESHVRYEPIGACALIASFNYPMLIATWKVAPCLAAGSTCVLKPSEHTSFTALELAAIAMEVGLPPGVLNVVTGPGNITGAALIEHPGIDKIAFTGSVATGSHVMKVSSKKITKTTLELGGKSPLIVCRDAEIEKICDWLLIGIFFNGGQVCSATSRILVHKDLYPKLLEKLTAEAKKIVIGSGLEEDTQLGPLVSEAQQRRVLDFIQKGKSEGAKIITGGTTDPKAHGAGYFVEPTIFADVKPWMKIWKDEIFGPVLCVASFETEAEAITLANDSQYGLAGAVFSSDAETCRRIARSLRCGIVWINCSQPTFVQAPWGGYKQSGVGRELGPWGLQNYLQTKQITQWVDKTSSGWGWYQHSKL
jgi:betaine-aldehyde dehydrogenase